MLLPEKVPSLPKWFPLYLERFPRSQGFLSRMEEEDKRRGMSNEWEMVSLNDSEDEKESYVSEEMRKMQIERGVTEDEVPDANHDFTKKSGVSFQYFFTNF